MMDSNGGNGGSLSVGQRLSNIEELLKGFIQTSQDEIREARHLAKNALHGISLQQEINKQFRRDIDRIDRRYSEDIKPLLSDLKRREDAHEGEDTFRKWLWPVLFAAAAVAVAISDRL